VFNRDVELPYYWIFVKPDSRILNPSEQTAHTAVTERVQDTDAAFSIDPEAGMLPPGKTASFLLTFAPSRVRSFLTLLNFFFGTFVHHILSPYLNLVF
jgi:hypothetical protein